MTRNKSFLILGFVGLSIIAILYFNKRFYRPFLNHKQTESIVQQLEDSDLVINGDIIFQTSKSNQSKAIQFATHSKYSHCGIIFWDNGYCWVWEANNGVTVTSLDKFIERGEGKHFVIKRLIKADAVFAPDTVIMKMSNLFYNQYYQKAYDLYFDWSDDKMYCSELIWKLYKQSTGLEIGKLEKLQDFDLTNDIVKQKMKERYGNNIPLDEAVISPASIFNSDLLRTIKEN